MNNQNNQSKMNILIWRMKTNDSRILVRARWVASEGLQQEDDLYSKDNWLCAMDNVAAWALTAAQMGMAISIRWAI